MAWVRLEDSFHAHPKVERAGNEAVGLYVRAIAYSASYLTDGKIDRHWAVRCAGRRANSTIERLVKVGLWEVIDKDHWVIHDYLKFNPSREEVLAKREAERVRKVA